MTRRKIQLVGGSTYSVSLPKEWAETHGVEPGDEVSLHAHIDGSLVVATCTCGGTNGVPDQFTFEIDGHDVDELTQLMNAAYAAGVGRVTFVADEELSTTQRRAIAEAASELTGVTVHNETDNVIRANTPLDPEEISIRQSVRHLSFVALSMHRNATAALFGETNPELVLDQRGQVTRLHALVDRHFHRSLSRLAEVDALGITREELFGLWVASRELEQVSDTAVTIAETAQHLDAPPKGPLAEDLRETAQTARECVETATTAVIEEADLGALQRSIADSERVNTAVTTLDSRVLEKGVSNPRLIRAIDAIKRTSGHGTAIAETGLRGFVSRCEYTTDGSSAGGTRDNTKQFAGSESDYT